MYMGSYGARHNHPDVGEGFSMIVWIKIYKGNKAKAWKTIKGTSGDIKDGPSIIYGGSTVCLLNRQIGKDYSMGKTKVKIKLHMGWFPPGGTWWMEGLSLYPTVAI